MALKPNSTFNLNKQAKRILATILDPIQRSLAKKAFIDAQLQSETKAPKEAKSGNNRKVEAE
jgi:hypothetical protein